MLNSVLTRGASKTGAEKFHTDDVALQCFVWRLIGNQSGAFLY